jgi:hypothetical protein
MITNEDEVKAAAQHIWQQAKTIKLTACETASLPPMSAGNERAFRVAGFDVHDRLIADVTGSSLEDLKVKLDGMIPEGGQAP